MEMRMFTLMSLSRKRKHISWLSCSLECSPVPTCDINIQEAFRFIRGILRSSRSVVTWDTILFYCLVHTHITAKSVFNSRIHSISMRMTSLVGRKWRFPARHMQPFIILRRFGRFVSCLLHTIVDTEAMVPRTGLHRRMSVLPRIRLP